MSTATSTTAQLQGRARRLRSQAASLHPMVADAYRRRAAELDVLALLDAVWNPPIDMGPLPTGDPEGTALRATPVRLAVA